MSWEAKPLGGACYLLLTLCCYFFYIVFTSRVAVRREAADISQCTGLGREPTFVYCHGASGKLNSYWELNGNL